MKALAYLLPLLVIGSLLQSCKESGPEGYEDPFCGLASPIVFFSDTAEFVLSDYILDQAEVDTLRFPAGIAVRERGNHFLFIRKPGLTPLSSLLVIMKSGDRFRIPIRNQPIERVEIRFNPHGKSYRKVQVRGEMNKWNALSSRMEKINGIWTEEFLLPPGEYQYLLVVDGREQLDPANPDKIDNNIGGYNSLLKVGTYRQEDLPFLITEGSGSGVIALRSTEIPGQVMAFWENEQIESRIDGEHIFIDIPAKSQLMDRSHIRVFAAGEAGFSNDILIPLEKGEVVLDPHFLNRFDRQTMLMYFLMVDRFRNGDTTNDEPVNDPEILPKANYYGGDLAGVYQAQQEGYFDMIGANTIWLSPITQNPTTAYGLYPDPHTRFSGYHGYWPVSSTRIDYRFGSTDDLLKIVGAAHARNQNVLLDYVANHVHELHPVYREHPEWATNLYLPDGTLNTEKWDEYRLTTWFDTFLPTLDLSRPEVVNPMTDSALIWITEYGIDGFRHDATKHIDELFWRTLTAKLKRVSNCDPPVYQIGETYGSPELISSYINSGMLDGQFDFNLYDNAVAVFGRDKESFVRLKNSLTQSLQTYGYHNLMGNITGNQDRPRFISLAGGDLKFNEDAKYAGWTRDIEVGDPTGYKKLMMLHAFNLTIPGIPVIYYGDEFGLPGANDPDNRRWMKFDDLTPYEADVLETVRKLAALRNGNMALLYGDLRFLRADGKVLIYAREYMGQTAIVLFNKSHRAQAIHIPFSAIRVDDPLAQFHYRVEQDESGISLELPPMSFELLMSK